MSPNPVSAGVEALAQAVAERVVKLVVDAIDLDALIDRVDVDRIVERVDVNRIVERVDVEEIVKRIDVQQIVQRIDVNAIVNEIDIDNLVQQTELGSIIARSTTGVLTELLDVVRSQGVALDDFTFRWANRFFRRRAENYPLGPRLLMEAETPA